MTTKEWLEKVITVDSLKQNCGALLEDIKKKFDYEIDPDALNITRSGIDIILRKNQIIDCGIYEKYRHIIWIRIYSAELSELSKYIITCEHFKEDSDGNIDVKTAAPSHISVELMIKVLELASDIRTIITGIK